MLSQVLLDVARALQEDLGSGDLTAGLIDPTRRARARVLARKAPLSVVPLGDGGAARSTRRPHHLACAGGPALYRRPGGAGGGGSAAPCSAPNAPRSTFCSCFRPWPPRPAPTWTPWLAPRPTSWTRKDPARPAPGAKITPCAWAAVPTTASACLTPCSSKENHIAAAGVTAVLRAAEKVAAQAQFIEIEVETLAQLTEALEAGARMVLLDNMDVATLHEAVRINAGRAILKSRAASRSMACAPLQKPVWTASPSVR